MHKQNVQVDAMMLFQAVYKLPSIADFEVNRLIHVYVITIVLTLYIPDNFGQMKRPVLY